MADSFLGRWSQRKQAVREGKPVEELIDRAVPAQSHASIAPSKGLAPSDPRVTPTAAAQRAAEVTPPATEAQQPAPPTMQDVAELNAESDFKPFVARAVAPEVRNAAMKKLFADPHFNVMDGLDIYIDDYSIPDPLPASMLRKMASAQFLKLFDEEDPAQLPAGSVAVTGTSPVLTQAEPEADLSSDQQATDAPDTDTSPPEPANMAATEPDKTDPPV